MRISRFVALTLTVASGCSESSGPKVSLAVGRYAYTSNVPRFVNDVRVEQSYAGFLTITFVSPDSIVGTWEVPGFRTDARLGWKHEDAYSLYSYTSPPTPPLGMILHRIRPDLGCTARNLGLNPGGTCTLTKQ